MGLRGNELFAEARGRGAIESISRSPRGGPLVGWTLIGFGHVAGSPDLSGAGFAVAPTYGAVYQYDPPGSRVRTHVDTPDYELVLHLILEHALPRDGATIHSWEPLRADEDQIMIAVGFASAA